MSDEEKKNRGLLEMKTFRELSVICSERDEPTFIVKPCLVDCVSGKYQLDTARDGLLFSRFCIRNVASSEN